MNNLTTNFSTPLTASNGKRDSASRVKSSATQFIPVLLRHGGEREEFCFLPVCAMCSEPIRDFEEANVVTIGSSDSDAPLESLGALGDGEAFRLPGTAVVVHLDCDQRKWKPWVRASSIFRKDQRGCVEMSGVCK